MIFLFDRCGDVEMQQVKVVGYFCHMAVKSQHLIFHTRCFWSGHCAERILIRRQIHSNFRIRCSSSPRHTFKSLFAVRYSGIRPWAESQALTPLLYVRARMGIADYSWNPNRRSPAHLIPVNFNRILFKLPLV